jgi:hypothetical protein
MLRRPTLAPLLLAGLLAMPVFHAHAAATQAEYAAIRAEIRSEQAGLQARWQAAEDEAMRAAVIEAARMRVFHVIVHQLIPAWEGTPWDFWGTTQVPGQGQIACGYYVSTLLEHAGFEVERVKLAQQASEKIIKTFTEEEQIWRTSDATVERSLRPVVESGAGIYIVGLDYHVGLLVNDGEQIRFCDSSYINPSAVLCQDPAEAFSYSSRYRVIGKLLDDDMLVAWLEGQALPTWTGTLH